MLPCMSAFWTKLPGAVLAVCVPWPACEGGMHRRVPAQSRRPSHACRAPSRGSLRPEQGGAGPAGVGCARSAIPRGTTRGSHPRHAPWLPRPRPSCSPTSPRTPFVPPVNVDDSLRLSARDRAAVGARHRAHHPLPPLRRLRPSPVQPGPVACRRAGALARCSRRATVAHSTLSGSGDEIERAHADALLSHM